jgi:hypothetical protein
MGSAAFDQGISFDCGIEHQAIVDVDASAMAAMSSALVIGPPSPLRGKPTEPGQIRGRRLELFKIPVNPHDYADAAAVLECTMFDDDDIDPWMDKYELAFVDAAVDILGASERANCWSERNARHILMIPTAYGIGALTPRPRQPRS